MNEVGPVAVVVPNLPVLGLMVLTVSAVLLRPGTPCDEELGDPAGRDAAPRRRLAQRMCTFRGALARLTGVARGRDEAEEVLVLDGLAAALEAGLSTGQALHLALDAGDHPGGRSWSWSWDELWRASGEGQPLAPVWARVARRTGSPTMSTVARAWAVASATGAPLAAAVRASAEAARERRRLHRAVEVATAGARATVRVLTLLPLAGVGLAALLGIGPLELYSHPWAAASAGAGVLLLGVGRLLVGRLVGGVVRGVA